ncbi:RICIN domain-containing protein [Streptomyces sp. NPDC086554]|uniref:RICIN domain-containing protein n=1 Tax=Streptomyces sp. NPDC086554 TaxID=3154864 RepID=UPI00343A8D03
MWISRPLAIPVGLGLAACALAGTTPTAHADSAAPASGSVYTLQNAESGNLMDVQYASTAPGAPISQWKSNNGANQQWALTKTSSGAYTVMSANSGLCLDTPDPQNSNPPVQLVQNRCDGSARQQWNIGSVGDGTYTLTNADNGLLVDYAQSTTDATKIIQRKSNDSATQHWTLTPLTRVGTHTAGLMYNGRSFNNESIRMAAHTTVAGSMLRVRLSNRYGNEPLTIDAVDLARQSSTPGTAVPGTHRPVTFNGSASVTIPAGQDVASDPIPMAVDANTNQLVSLHLPHKPAGTTWHEMAQETTWISTAGNHVTDDGTGNYPATEGSWYFLEGLDVISPTATGTLVCVGDSITDGAGSTPGANRRWPDYLAQRMNSASGGPTLGVVDAGISSNHVLRDVSGNNPSLKSRFDHDVLGQPNVKSVILLEGINDIGNNIGSNGSSPVTFEDLRDGMLSVISKARAAGVKIIGGTILPYEGAPQHTAYGEQVRQDVNQWIRTSREFDDVIDFDKAMQDPRKPLALNPAYDTGDHLHPNDAGYQAMADAVNLAALTP